MVIGKNQKEQIKAIHSKQGNQKTRRKILIDKLHNREVGLTGGQYTRGTNFNLKHFSNKNLKRMLESSRPLGSEIKTHKLQKGIFVLDSHYQNQNINTDKNKTFRIKDSGLDNIKLQHMKYVEGFVQHLYPKSLQTHEGFKHIISRLQKGDDSNLHGDLEHADSLIKQEIGWKYSMGEDDRVIEDYEKAWRSFHLPKSYFNRKLIQEIDEHNNGSLALVLKKIYNIPYGSTTIEDYGEKRRRM